MKLILSFFFTFIVSWVFSQETIELSSPKKSSNVIFSKINGEWNIKVFTSLKDTVQIEMGTFGKGFCFSINSNDDLCITTVDLNNEYNEYLLHKKDLLTKIRLRIFNNSFAFRYEDASDSEKLILGEFSSWKLPKTTSVWYFERKNAWKLKSYAGVWESCDISNLTDKSFSDTHGLPIVFRLPRGEYGFITEVGLFNYSGMRLKVTSDNILKADFTEAGSGFIIKGKYNSPWRVIGFAKDLNELVNQNMTCSLAPKPDNRLFSEKSYIIPGKSVWSWFSKGVGTPDEEKKMIDDAALLNFNYSTIDEGWRLWNDNWATIHDLVSYAQNKGVRLFLWQHSKQLLNPKEDYKNMRLFLDSVKNVGAAGIKVDFMDSEAKSVIDFEIRLLEECAKRSLLVNFHGCHKPTGESYTYPNEITREGIRGMELNKMKEGFIPAYHNAALPFTRFIVGHGDYTPLSFTVPGSTTFAHQLATLICFDSPLQVIAEDPELLLTNKYLTPALDFIRTVPTVWDEVRVLPPSEIQKIAIIAKRKGKEWYIGILNGEKTTKCINLNLNDFITNLSESYALIDDVAAEKVLLPMNGHRKSKMSRLPSVPFKRINKLKSVITLTLAPEGGAVFVLK